MTPIQAIRKHCLDCCGGSSKTVKFCTCDGVNSTPACHLWPLRFGMRPQTARKRYGDKFLSPKDMPPSDVELASLQG